MNWREIKSTIKYVLKWECKSSENNVLLQDRFEWLFLKLLPHRALIRFEQKNVYHNHIRFTVCDQLLLLISKAVEKSGSEAFRRWPGTLWGYILIPPPVQFLLPVLLSCVGNGGRESQLHNLPHASVYHSAFSTMIDCPTSSLI